jgi:tripartite-type tricarboxylate transporter receptor subunit TctC
MGKRLRTKRIGVLAGLLLGSFFSFPADSGAADDYPSKPITLYCGYVAGATTDLTTRALAIGAEKILGVPIMVENKAGGSSTVCAALLAGKKPDGYTLGVIDSGVITRSPQIHKITYDPQNGFTHILQYSRFIGALCVRSDSPVKTVDDFIAWAKSKPGLTYGTPGQYTQQHLAVELFSQCKNLNLKHVPYKGGAEAITAFLGKHTDFLGGSGSHIPYVRQGAFRVLFIYNADKRDPVFPDIPIQRELGCEDAPPTSMVLSGPKGMPAPVVKKIFDAFKKVADGAEFQDLLKQLNLPYDFKDRARLEKDLAAETEWYRTFLKKFGVKKET